MLLNHKQLIGLLVKTENGQELGQIKDFEFDSDSYKIIKYIISSSGLVKKMLANDLIIDSTQVIKITDQEMIVDDNTARQPKIAEEIAST